MPANSFETKRRFAGVKEPWYRDRATLVALITGFISSALSLLNVYLSVG